MDSGLKLLPGPVIMGLASHMDDRICAKLQPLAFLPFEARDMIEQGKQDVLTDSPIENALLI